MSKCLTCEKKGLLLKLTNGVCNSCYSELKDLEKKYYEIIDEMANDNYDNKKVEVKLNKLIVKVRKFQALDKTIKVDDCIRVLNSLTSTPITNSTNPNNLTLEHTTKATKTSASAKLVSFKKIAPSNPYVEKELVYSNEQLQNLYPMEESPAVADNLISSNSISNINSPIETSSVNSIPNINAIPVFNTIPNIDSIPVVNHTGTTPKKSDTNKTENESLVIDTQLLNNLYDETSKIIEKLTDTTLSTEDLAYHVLLLKNTYLKNLNMYNMKEVNGYNVQNIIDTTSSKVAVKLECEKEDIYDFFNYVTVGIQTTGQFLPNSEIIELYANKISYGNIVDTYHTLIKPIKPISRIMEVNTGISAQDLTNCPNIDVVLQEFSSFCDGMKLISYNSQFVSSFLNHYSNLFFINEFNNKTECLLKLYRTRFKNYHGEPCKVFDLNAICNDILTFEDLSEINSHPSKAFSYCLAAFKLYEVLKYRYK